MPAIAERPPISGFLDENDPNITITEAYLKGQRIAADFSISPDQKATSEEAIRCVNGFVSLSGVHAGEVGDVANISFGLPWHENGESFTPIAERIASLMSGGYELEWIGDRQVDVYIEADLNPNELLKRLVEAPIEAYKNQPYLSEAMTEAQNLRRGNILGQIGKGQIFRDIFYGRRHGLIRAYQPADDTSIEDDSETGRMSFVWNNETVGDELVGLALNNKRQTLTELAASPVVTPEMSEGILRRQKLLTGVKGRNRFLISVYFDPSVVCCRSATNAQYSEANYFKTPEMIEGSQILQSSISELLPTLRFGYDEGYKPQEEKDWCKEHNKKKTECNCGKEESKKSN